MTEDKIMFMGELLEGEDLLNSELPGTQENVERSGDRNDLALSSAMRHVPNVRHLDMDLYQYDPSGLNLEICIEATSDRSRYSPHQKTQMVRKIAKAMGAWTVLMYHGRSDHGHRREVTIFLWNPDGSENTEIWDTDMSWNQYLLMCQRIHNKCVAERRAKRRTKKYRIKRNNNLILCA